MRYLAPRTRNIGAAIIGNTLEWFDILVYAYFVKSIAANFFPASSGASSLLLAYGTFGLSFIARPLGAVVLGRIADTSGRRTALVYASALMCVGTLAIAILPPYSSIGVVAPLLLLLARLVQGFSAGGEFGSATAYLAEQSAGRRAFYSSWQFASQGLGMVLAALIGLTLGEYLSATDMMAWGWRIPFLLGALVGPLAYYIRRHIDETLEFLVAESQAKTSIARRSAGLFTRCAAGSGAVLACTVTIYFLVYIPSFAQSILHAEPGIAYTTALVSGVTLFVGAPLAGLAADRFGALRLGLLSMVLLMAVAYPIFAAVVAGHSKTSILLGQFALSAVAALYLGALPAILANLFDTSSRSFGLAVSYNLSVMTGGGFAQMIFVLLIGWTGSTVAPSYYVLFAGAVSFCALLACAQIARVDWANGNR
jgi:MHS family proline/betaine transporter-like MFS transporter